jgi:transcriptional regulator with XRE-family HTH domain
MKSKICERIKELRLENKITQGELAEKCLVQQSCVSKWERGATLPDADMIVKLTKISADPGYEIGLGDTTNTTIKNMLNGADNTNQGCEKYWLGESPASTDSNRVWVVNGFNEKVTLMNVTVNNNYGVRPVLTVYKSDVTSMQHYCDNIEWEEYWPRDAVLKMRGYCTCKNCGSTYTITNISPGEEFSTYSWGTCEAD